MQEESDISSPAETKLSTPSQSSAASQRSSFTASPESNFEIEEPNEVGNLSPADRGKTAYLFLSAAFVVEGVTWSFPATYGVLLDAYFASDLAQKPHATTLLPVVGIVAQSAMYFFGPPGFILCNWYPNSRQMAMWIGSILSVVSLAAASFATQPWHLLLTQGFLYSIGGALQYYTTFSFLMEHFVERRGLANGVCFAGTAAGGVFLPFIYRALLSNYSIPTTLRALSVGQAVCLGCVQPFIKGRLPPVKGPSIRRPLGYSMSMFRNGFVWLFLFINTLQGIAFFMPPLWLPTYVTHMHAASSVGPATVMAYNASEVISRVTLGWLSDRYSAHLLGSASSFGGAACVFLLWGAAGNYLAAIIIFAIAYGTVAGGYSSLWSGAMKQIVGHDHATASAFFGLCNMTRGIGAIIGGPVSSVLVGRSSGYWPLIIYTGTALASSSVVQLGDAFLSRKKTV